MAKGALTVAVRIDGARELLAALNRLPKDANVAIRDQSRILAEDLAGKAVAAAQSDAAPQSALLAPTIRARRDRVPAIAAGGSRRVGRDRVPAWKVLFGAEFGSNRYRQFGRVHSGRRGYWFFPLVERESSRISAAWLRAADDVIATFSRDGV